MVVLDGLEVFMSWPVEPPWLTISTLRTEVGRCSGHCCRAFTMPLSNSDIENMKAALDAEERGEPWPVTLWRPKGIEVIARMVRPMGPFHILTPAGHRFKDNTNWYTCEHHDPESGNCMIYERRPEMCRDHPYGNECNYLDCTRRESTEKYIWVGPPNVHEPVRKPVQDIDDPDSLGVISRRVRGLEVFKPEAKAWNGAERVLWAVVVAAFGETCFRKGERLGRVEEVCGILGDVAVGNMSRASFLNDFMPIINRRIDDLVSEDEQGHGSSANGEVG